MADETTGGNATHNPNAQNVEENLSAAASHVQAGARRAMADAGLEREGPSLATAALVGVGVAILEPEFIPGMLIGAGALLAPKILPGLGNLLRPMVKGVVKAGYAATMAVRESVAEAGENVQDMVAEARAEYDRGHTAEPEQAAPAEPQQKHRRPGRNPSPATNL